MPKKLELKGKRFGKLLVVGYLGQNKYHKTVWLVRCDCGTEKAVIGSSMTSGSTTSCGCDRDRAVKNLNWKHGGRGSTEYNIWKNMRQRCNNPRNPAYKNYGARGVKICARWDDFSLFLKDVGKRPTERHTLDRIDNDGNCESGNCRWALRRTQSRNTRRNRRMTYKGKTQVLTDWANELDIDFYALMWRLDNGWTVERAFTTPSRRHS